MPHRPSRLAAVLAMVALLLAAPFERGRACDVCPVDCPIHRAAKLATARAIGCHHGSEATAPAPRQTPDDACAMRASCGHHARAELVVFHAELAPAVVSGLARVARPVLPDTTRVVTADAPAPLDRPPEALFV